MIRMPYENKRLAGYRRNIPKNYIFVFFQNFRLTHGIWMLYLSSRGLSFLQIGSMESLFHLSSIVFEVPTGVVADLLGRKFSRIIGRLASIVSIILLIYSSHIVWFGLAFVLDALSFNLESGAGDALLYDSVKAIGEKSHYLRIVGRQELFFQLAATASLLLGGYLAQYSYDLVYRLSLLVALITFMLSFCFVEPRAAEIKDMEENWEKPGNRGARSILSDFKGKITDSIYILRHHDTLGFLLIVSEIYGALAMTVFYYMQVYLYGLGYSEFWIGAFLSLAGLSGAIVTWNAFRIEKRLGFRRTLKWLALLGVAAFWGILFRPVLPMSVIGLLTLESMVYVVVIDYINRLITSDKRATMLSFQSMLYSFFMILIFPLVGKIGDVYGLYWAFVLVVGLATICLGWVYLSVKFNKTLGIIDDKSRLREE